MPDRERDLERELRDLGPRVEYPRTPDLAGSVRRRIEREDEARANRRGLFWLPVLSPRWAVAAMFVIVLVIPVLSPAVRDELSGIFIMGGDAGYGGGGAAQSAGKAEDARAGQAGAGGGKMASEPAGQAQSQEDPGQASTPESTGSGVLSSGPTFHSPDQMVATADLICTGAVTKVLPGKVEAAGTPDAVRDTNVVIGVDEVLKGDASTESVTVKTPQLAYDGPQNTEWRRTGERVLLFLSHSREKETKRKYIVAGTSYGQTAYILQNADLVATASDPLSRRVAHQSLPELRREIQEAKAKIRRGEVEPLQPER
ncbi:hypothetical protein BH18ACT10_BH18ACT10_07120 [soil metagenome]